MISFTISLPTVDAVRKFVGITGAYAVDVDLAVGQYIVDGKSIMGIFSLPHGQPVSVQIHEDAHPTQAQALSQALASFRV